MCERVCVYTRLCGYLQKLYSVCVYVFFVRGGGRREVYANARVISPCNESSTVLSAYNFPPLDSRPNAAGSWLIIVVGHTNDGYNNNNNRYR